MSDVTRGDVALDRPERRDELARPRRTTIVQRGAESLLAAWRRQPSARTWLLVGLALTAWVLLFTPLGRYLEFDEATFYGQSGGLNGLDAPIPWMAASREHGTAVLIGALRLFTTTLASTQFAWTLLSVAIVLLGFYEAGRWTGRRGALVGATVLMTCWLSTVLAGSFYGSFMGAGAALLTMGLYLRLKHQTGHELRNGVLLGLALALLFAMRNVESLLVAAIIGGHAVVWRPLLTLQRWRGLAVAFVIFVVTFVVPWTMHTLSRWDSVLERYLAARGQGHPFGLHNGVGEWSRLLLGIDPHLPLSTPTPALLVWIYAALLIAAIVVALAYVAVRLVLFVGRRPPIDAGRHVGLIFVLAFASLGLFLFLSQDLKERYLGYGLTFGFLLFGHAAVYGFDRLQAMVRGSRRMLPVAVVVLFAVWLGIQGSIVASVQAGRVRNNQTSLRLSGTIAALAQGRECLILGRTSSPQYMIASGCRTGGGRGQLGRGFDSLERRLANRRYPWAEVVFVVWGEGVEILDDDFAAWEEREGVEWQEIPEPRGIPDETLSYMIRP